MTHTTRFRTIAFLVGVAAVLASLSTFIAAHFRPIDTSDYLKQGEEGVPWVQFGLGSAAVGVVFSMFGRRWQRVFSAGLGFVLLVCWYLIAESLF